MDLDLDRFRTGDPMVTANYRTLVTKQLRRHHRDPAVLEELASAVIGDLIIAALTRPAGELPQTYEDTHAWVHNACRTHSRRELTRRARWATLRSFLQRRSPHVTQTLRAREVLRHFDDIASKLPNCDYQIFQMKAEGMSPTEIAEELRQPRPFVKRRLKQIRDRLEVELLRETADPSLSIAARMRAHRRLHSFQRADLW